MKCIQQINGPQYRRDIIIESCFIVDLFLYIYQIFELENILLGNNSHIKLPNTKFYGIRSRDEEEEEEKHFFKSSIFLYFLFISVMLWMLNINNPHFIILYTMYTTHTFMFDCLFLNAVCIRNVIYCTLYNVHHIP